MATSDETIRNSRMSPPSVTTANRLAREILDQAEGYHTATYMHEPLKGADGHIYTISAHTGMSVPAEAEVRRISNFPMTPVVRSDGQWAPQGPMMAASAHVIIALNIKNRPALKHSSRDATWRVLSMAAASLRAAAWDYMTWVPSEGVVRVHMSGARTANVYPGGSGRVACQALSSYPMQVPTAVEVQFMTVVYDTWRHAFAAGYATAGHPEAACRLDMMAYAGRLLAVDNPLAHLMASNTKALVVMCQLAITAIPMEYWPGFASATTFPPSSD